MRRLRLLAVFLLTLIAISGAWIWAAPRATAGLFPQAPRLQRVPVLLYHHLVPEGGLQGDSIMTVTEFARQMADLHAQGYQALSTQELLDWLEGRITIPAKSVLITFDDGYASGYDLAWPVLKQYGFKATIFIISSQIGKTPGIFPHLTPEQMAEMGADGLIEFQDHSFDGHRHLNGGPALTLWSAPEIEQDLVKSQSAFVAAGLPRPRAFAYPFGASNERLVGELKAEGYRLGFAGETGGYVSRGDDPMRLRRIVAYNGMRLP